MANNELLQYINRQIKNGFSKEEITATLLKTGWKKEDVDAVFFELNPKETAEEKIGGFQAVNSKNLSKPPEAEKENNFINNPLPPKENFTRYIGAENTQNTSDKNSRFKRILTMPNVPHKSQFDFRKSDDFIPKKPFRKGLFFTVLLFILIIGGGSGAFAYFYYFQKGIFQNALSKKISEVESVEYKGKISLKINDLKKVKNIIPLTEVKISGENINIDIAFQGKSDINDINNPKSSAGIKFSVKQGAKKFSFNFDAVSLKDTSYIKFGKLPNIGFFNTDSIENKWIKADKKSIENQFNIGSGVKNKNELTLEQSEKLRDIVKSINFFKLTENLGKEEINNITAYHYKFIVDKENVKKFIIESNNVLNETDEETVEEITEALEETLQVFSDIKGEIWIGKKDKLPYKITLNIDFKETEDYKASGEVLFLIEFRNYNVPFTIKKPENSVPLEEILKDFMGFVKNATLAKRKF